jgi:hypothetical protein
LAGITLGGANGIAIATKPLGHLAIGPTVSINVLTSTLQWALGFLPLQWLHNNRQ